MEVCDLIVFISRRLLLLEDLGTLGTQFTMACCCWWISLTHQCCLVIASELCPNPMVDNVPNIIPSALLHSSPCCVSAIPFPGFGTRCLGNPVFSLRLGSIVKTRYKDRVFVAGSRGYNEVSL
jgi:hypothetical protein